LSTCRDQDALLRLRRAALNQINVVAGKQKS
jgi:hypothetical protein